MKFDQNFFKTFFVLFLSALVLTGCQDDEGPEENGDSFDRNGLLVNVADNIIIPRYADLNTATTEMNSSAIAFSEDVSEENLESLRNAWYETLKAWQYAGMFDFGPAFSNGLLSAVNLYPIDTVKVKDNIALGNYNLESSQNTDATGLQALDYLLYGKAESDAALLAYFQNNPNALTYITDITGLMEERISATTTAWQGDYRNNFVGAGGTDIGSALGQLINASIRYYERNLRDGKIGIPAGARTTSGEPLPAKVECLYSEIYSREMLTRNVEAWQNLFNGVSHDGTDGLGIDDYLNYLGTNFDPGMPLQEEINDRFDLVLEKTELLSPNLASAVVTNQNQALEVFDEMQRVVVLLKVDMTSALGVQITYADNDGD